MYRATMNRVLQAHRKLLWRGNANLRISRFSISANTNSNSSNPQSFVNQTPNDQSIPSSSSSQIPIYTDSTSSASPSSSSSGNERHGAAGDGVKRPRFGFQDEQARVLQASLQHVVSTQLLRRAVKVAIVIRGAKSAREVGLSPAIIGSFPRKEATLVEFFMDACLQKIIDVIDSEEDASKNVLPSERISKLVRIRLEMQAPYLSKWPQALSIQAQPLNVPTSFKQRAMLVDEIWHTVGVEASDLDWYVKRTILGGIYSTTEVYMLTDNSPEFRDTWAFLDNRVKEAFDLKKTMQEAKHIAESVGAGIGNSMEGFMKRLFSNPAIFTT